MKSIIIIFAAMLLIIATPFVFTAIDDGVTEATTNSFANVPVGSGNATVTLSRSIYNNDVQAVTGVTSNESADAPTAFTFNSVSKALLVTGLAASNNRTLSVEFQIDSTKLPTSGGTIYATLIRWFWIFTIVGTIIGAIYAFFD